jgi:hypothetical protein
MPKQDIRMADDEIDRFLRSQTTALIIATAGEAAPQGAVGRLLYDQRRVSFSLADSDPVVRLLVVDDRACCMVEQFPSYFEIMGVMLHGHATRRQESEPGVATFDLDVDKIVSFDFGKLALDRRSYD